MTDWRTDIDDAVRDFLSVAALARDPISQAEIEIEFLAAPHALLRGLPAETMAVYGFWHDGIWLKIGKAGPNSNPRYAYQHYTGSARSTLVESLVNDPTMARLFGSDRADASSWIKSSTCRVNILLPAARQPALLSLLEVFLHLRLRPRYEG